MLVYSTANAQIELQQGRGSFKEMSVFKGDTFPYITTLSIQDEDSTIFYYTTEDSSLIVKDSLRTIKFLIDLVLQANNKRMEEFKEERIPSPAPHLVPGEGIYIDDKADGFIYSGALVKKIDTIPVLFLYSDNPQTNKVKQPAYVMPFGADFPKDVGMSFALPMYGYMWYEETEDYEAGPDWDDASHFLDDRKQPLPKGTIIWQVKYLD